MDYQLLMLFGMIAATVFIGVKSDHWWPLSSLSPRHQYHRFFSATAVGLLFLVAGLIGWDLKYSRGWFQGTTWVAGPIWWQVALGTALLLLAGFWARRLPLRPAR
jgi:hypothetical protein